RNCLEQLLLHPGQVDRRSVTAAKARCGDRHLFAFELRGDSADEYHYIGFACCTQCCLNGVARHSPLQTNVRISRSLKILELDFVVAASLKIDRCSSRFASMRSPVIDQQGAVYP